MMQIFTYVCADPDCPPERRCVASMDGSGPGKHWMVHGPTEAAARAKLEGFLRRAEPRIVRPPKKRVEADDFDVI
jgi:hypothetical protein